jgi:hypothetical protein
MQPGWEPQREALSPLTIFHQPSYLSRVEGGNDRMMVQVMDQRHPKCNPLQVVYIPLLRQDVVWLGMVPSPHPLLLPHPLFLGCLHLAPAESKFSRSVDKIYFI